MKRLLTALICLAPFGLQAAPALAHARLLRSYPPEARALTWHPSHVSFTFDDPVSLPAIRVYDAHGRLVPTTPAIHPAGDPKRILSWLRRRPASGAYGAVFRVLADDGHVETGGVTFAVDPAGAPATRLPGTGSLSVLLRRESPGQVTDFAAGAARAGEYAALAIVLGGMAFITLVWLPALDFGAGPSPGWERATLAFARRHQLLLITGARAGAGLAALSLGLQAASASAESLWRVLAQPVLLWRLLGTHSGLIGLAAVAAWLGLARNSGRVWMHVPRLRRIALGADGLALQAPVTSAWTPSMAGAVAVVALAPALAGHAYSRGPALLMVPIAGVHTVAMSLWAGGLLALAVTVPAAGSRLEAPERATLWTEVAGRFSRVAMLAVVALVTTGVLQVVAYENWQSLVDSRYGALVLVKAGLAVVLIAVGWHNRNRLLPSLRRSARVAAGGGSGAPVRSLRRTVTAEVVLVSAALAVTAALAGTAPEQPPTLSYSHGHITGGVR
jgi:copper transport protein